MTEKTGAVIDREDGFLRLQNDLGQLVRWAGQWQKEFNSDKHVVMHLEWSNERTPYIMTGRLLGSVEEQRDLVYRFKDP